MMTDLAALFAATEQQYGLPPGYLMRTAQIESGLNPQAKNPNSSASGLFQFINSTAQDYGLSDPFNPAMATDAAGRLARDNMAFLTNKLGRAPTPAELYLAHQQGPGGAYALLSNPNAPAASAVGGAAVGLNGGQGGQTAGDFANYWTGKFGGSAAESLTAPAGMGQVPLAFGPVGEGPAAPVFGQVAADWFNRQREQQQARAADDQARRQALFGATGPAAAGGSGLASLYG